MIVWVLRPKARDGIVSSTRWAHLRTSAGLMGIEVGRSLCLVSGFLVSVVGFEHWLRWHGEAVG